MRRVVITGIGIVAALGMGREAFWQSLISGNHVRTLPRQFDCRSYRAPFTTTVDNDALMAAVDLEPSDRCTHSCADFGLVAAKEALAQAHMDPIRHASDMGLSVGTTSGGCVDACLASVFFNSPVSLDALAGFSVSDATEQIAARLQLTGPVCTFSSACTSSAISVIHAVELIRNDDTDVMIAGGCDALREIDYAGFNALRILTADDIRPFDVDRKGMIIGDGAAMLVMEEMEHARSRGAAIIAEIKAFGMSCDAFHVTAPNALGAAAAMRAALAQADLRPDQIQYVNCHGTATIANDKAEITALETVFDSHGGDLYATSTKSSTGHLLGSVGGLEVCITALAIQHQMIPPMPTLRNLDPMVGFKVVQHDAIRTQIQHALSNSFGFGGNNASILIGRCT
jgi:3-oxoacyl-(acyl-carrier-protein) synthase